MTSYLESAKPPSKLPGELTTSSSPNPPGKRRQAARTISPALIKTIRARLAANKRVRRTLPGRGRLHIDRQLPFLCVYRRPSDREDSGTRDFVKSEASYLFASGSQLQRQGITDLVDGVVATLAPAFGAFLIVEIWSGSEGGKETDPRSPEISPRFKVYAPFSSTMSPAVETLVGQLKKIKILRQSVEVDVVRQERIAPNGMRPVLSKPSCHGIGLLCAWRRVAAGLRDSKAEKDYPLLMRALNRRFSNALRRAIFEFVRGQTTHKPPHYHSLGRRAVVKVVWDVDAQLAEVSNAFDFLLQVTPINPDAAWRQFKGSRFEKAPDFHYLPTPMNPALLKRQLYRVPIERVEDPALHHLFRQKQEEVDRKITMLRDRNRPAFLYGSLQLYGAVDTKLCKLAHEILSQTPTRSRGEANAGDGGCAAHSLSTRRQNSSTTERFSGLSSQGRSDRQSCRHHGVAWQITDQQESENACVASQCVAAARSGYPLADLL